MTRVNIVVACVGLLMSAFNSSNTFACQESGDSSAFDVTTVEENVPELLRRAFSKQVIVFGVNILATRDTPTFKVQHAANVLAQYLDNDEDGTPDNSRVIRAMKANQATLIMFATAEEAERIISTLESDSTELLDAMILQDLYGEETHPDGAAQGVFDATYEEVLHLITHSGYAIAYPDVFGERPGTELADAMDVARGGRFLRVPRRYPGDAWYTYDDETCDYGCQVTEYIYWGLTSLLEAQDYPGRADEIADEWRLNTSETFTDGDPKLHALLTDERYKFPTRLPNGKYRQSDSP